MAASLRNQVVQMYRTPLPPSGKRSDDKLDVGVVFFEKDLGADEYGGVYLSPDDLNPYERPIYDLPDRSHYLVLGYPTSKSRIDFQKQTSKTDYYNLTTEPMPPALYTQLGLAEVSHLILRFDPKRNVFSVVGRTTAPKPTGMSGGGIWRFESPRDFSQPSGKLVAILTEWIQRPSSILVGYRVSLALQAILENFPELSTCVEKHVPEVLHGIISQLRAASTTQGPAALAIGFDNRTAFVWADDSQATERLYGLLLVGGSPIGFVADAPPEGGSRRTLFRTIVDHSRDDPTAMFSRAEEFLASLVATYRGALDLRREDRLVGRGIGWPDETLRDFRRPRKE